MITLFIFFNINLFIYLILLMLNFLMAKKKKIDREKNSPFECGFDPFSSSRLPLSIQFYMIGIIFLIFDVEIIIFFPMIPSYLYSSFEENLLTTIIFILILLIGLFIEWNNGALKWIN